jgi:hypothetical protein
MDTVYFDSTVCDDTRRKQLFEGQLLVYSPCPSSLALRDFARDLLREAFNGMDPRTAQWQMPVEDYAAILGKLKPEFIHHAKSKELIRALLVEMECDPLKTYFDIPRMRSSTSNGYLTTGIAYAWHPHRDTWYSAPNCQINWWIPIYEIASENAMAFYPHYWNRPIRNDSAGYDYEEWNRNHRFSAVQYIKEDPRPLPRATESFEPDPQIRLICPSGGIILFSAAQMHASVPNISGVTRFSIDFRTVHYEDAKALRGAPNVDSECMGTTMSDYLRASDLSQIPIDIINLYQIRKSRSALEGNRNS